MSRKDKSFSQLIHYMADIDKSDEQYNIYHNLYARNLDDIETEFMHNAEYVHQRKNGVYMYHEILSITKAKHLDEAKQKALLRQIAYHYAQQRADNNLIFATLHDDHDHHLHYHFLISSNAVGDSKKTRLSKTQFDRFKKDLEQHTLEHFPELEQQIIINRQASEKLSRKGGERKRRTGKTPQRDELKKKLSEIFTSVSNKQDFFTALGKMGLELYVRGKTIGVKDIEHDRNHRLKTLGLLDEFTVMSDRFELDEADKIKTKTRDQEKRRANSKDETPTQSNETEQSNKQSASDEVKIEKPIDNEQETEQRKAQSTIDNTTEQMKQTQSEQELDERTSQAQKHQAEIETIRQQKKQSEEQTEHEVEKESQQQQKK